MGNQTKWHRSVSATGTPKRLSCRLCSIVRGKSDVWLLVTEDNKTHTLGGVKARNRRMRNRMYGGVGGQ